MGKNIVVFSDGTGQEGGKTYNTNVYKLFNMIEDRTKDQVAYYDRGLGTGWRKVTGNMAGMGISRNIRDCYQFIFENFEADDNIYLFGFSRGATTVRSLSGFIHLFGILPQSRPELIKRAYAIYRIKDQERRKEKAEELIAKNRTMWCRIKFLGVWDTVAALGLPFTWMDNVVEMIPWFKHRFHNLRLSESVENAYHALAIDDERLTFHPTLWDPVVKEYQNMHQVWFSGMHTDVGGGYREQQLSDIVLQWMVDKAHAHGLRIYPRHKVKIAPDPDGVMHDSRGKFPASLFRRAERSWPATHGTPVVHSSVVQRKPNQKNNADPPYNPWILRGKYEVE
ncbi:MAG: DUF2235 domain-containing protein [Bacteroidetes bacterium]|nr:DUF2235 domain-containing protein [Bacteroidota bacterium]MCW5895908.1 DUF2235 domain-containing protein [Bacteroidota bacterium]